MKHYEIKLHPTERTLHIFVGKFDESQIIEVCGKTLGDFDGLDGSYITHNIKGYVECVMWIKDPKSRSTYIHECVHCVTDIMEATGIDDDEFRAWYTEWLYNTIQDARGSSKDS